MFHPCVQAFSFPLGLGETALRIRAQEANFLTDVLDFHSQMGEITTEPPVTLFQKALEVGRKLNLHCLLKPLRRPLASFDSGRGISRSGFFDLLLAHTCLLNSLLE